MNELITQQTDLTSSIGEATEISWTAPDNLTYEQYEAIGRTFQQIKHSLSWWVGDWLNEGERRFADIYMQAVDDTGKAVETLLKWKAVADRVPKEIRRADLGWTFHFYVAYVPIEQRGLLLDLAANVGLSSRELKEVVKLDNDTRMAVLSAVSAYLDEQGPMSKEVFMRLLNRMRLDAIDYKPKKEKAERDEEDEEDEEDYDNEQEDSSERPADPDDVIDFWENQGVPLKYCTPSQASWDGMTVYVAQNANGKHILVWEETNG